MGACFGICWEAYGFESYRQWSRAGSSSTHGIHHTGDIHRVGLKIDDAGILWSHLTRTSPGRLSPGEQSRVQTDKQHLEEAIQILKVPSTVLGLYSSRYAGCHLSWIVWGCGAVPPRLPSHAVPTGQALPMLSLSLALFNCQTALGQGVCHFRGF